MGLPVCLGNPRCDRGPVRKGRCRKCYDAAGPEVRRPGRKFFREDTLGGPTAHYQLKVQVELIGRVARAAEAEQISAAEWWRRAAAEKLGQTPAARRNDSFDANRTMQCDPRAESVSTPSSRNATE